MTPEEVVDFISGETRCIVATLDPDGSPWGDAAACVYRDGLLYFRAAENSRTLRNLQADPRVCCTLEAMNGDIHYSAIAAMVHGGVCLQRRSRERRQLRLREDQSALRARLTS